MRDRRLVREGIATGSVDGAEHRTRVVGVHERTRPVVDGLTCYRHVVGVHHAMDEAHEQPLRYELSLACDNAFEERQVRLLSVKKLRVVPGQDIVREKANRLGIAPRREILEGSHPDVAGGDPRQHGSRKLRFAEHGLAGRYGGERTSSRDPEGSHRFADDVLAENRAEGRPAVAAARERRSPRALQMDVASYAVAVDDLPEQEGSSVAELRHEMPELVPGISHGNWFGAFGNTVAGQHLHAFWAGQVVRVEPQRHCQSPVQLYEPGSRDRRGLDARVESGGQLRVGVVEREAEGGFDILAHSLGPCAALPTSTTGLGQWLPTLPQN